MKENYQKSTGRSPSAATDKNIVIVKKIIKEDNNNIFWLKEK